MAKEEESGGVGVVAVGIVRLIWSLVGTARQKEEWGELGVVQGGTGSGTAGQQQVLVRKKTIK